MASAYPGEANPGRNSFMALASLDQAAMDALPQAVYLCAGDGRVVRFNQRAVDLWARVPRAGDPTERFCGSARLYRIDGTLLPHDQCPMATALETGESFFDHEVIVERPDGEQRTVLVNIAALRDSDGRVNGAVNCFQDITARKRAAEQQDHVIQELNHRIKNTFAIIHSLARNTARYAGSITEYAARFETRLLALNKAHVLLGTAQHAGVTIHDLLAQQLEAFQAETNPQVHLRGPVVELRPQLALDLSMVLHELVTNAAKYGSLSVAEGHVSVEWDLLTESEGDRVLTLRWEESGGPPVERPQATGFGTRLIDRTIGGGLDGRVTLLFEPSGLQLRMSIPLPN